MPENISPAIQQFGDSVNTEENGDKWREKDGTWKKGKPGGPGAPKQTEEEKEKKRALKEIIEDYKNKLTRALPEISLVLIRKAIDGDLQAIKEINNQVIGKPKQQVELSGDKENPPIIKEIRYIIPNDPNSSSNVETTPGV